MLEILSLVFGTAPAYAPPAVALAAPPVPEIHAPYPAPVVDAAAAIVVDLESGVTLFEKEADTELPIASLTKLVTALTAKRLYALDEIVTVSKNAAAQPPAKIWLRAGERIRVADLLAASLIRSGNDAAVALAEHHEGGYDGFVREMNETAAQLGLRHSHFMNPVGYDEEGNYSTVRDLVIVAGAIRRDPLLREITSSPRSFFTSTSSNSYELYSTNNLFGSYLNIHGLKTGTTDAAGQCLAAIARTEKENDVLAIVLNSPNRERETKVLLEWAIAGHRW